MTSTANSSCISNEADYSILPTHVITQILKHLPLTDFKSATLVCKSWYYGSTDPHFIRKLCARITSKNFQHFYNHNQRYYSKFVMLDANGTNNRNALIHVLTKYQRNLSEIEFFYCNNFNLAELHRTFLPNLPNLLSLTIKSRSNLFEITGREDGGAEACAKTNLKQFNLYTVFEFNSVTGVKNLTNFLNSMPNLDTLQIHSKFDAVFSDFMDELPKLNCLANLVTLSVHVTKHKNFVNLLKNLLKFNLNNMRTLKVYDAYYDSDVISVSNSDDDGVEYCDLIEKFCAKFSNLYEFHVGYVNDEILKGVAKHMKNLKALGISCAHQIVFTEVDIFGAIEKLEINVYPYYNSFAGMDHALESEVFKIFHNKFDRLRELKVNGEICSGTLRRIVKNCINLEVLEVNGLLHFDSDPHKISIIRKFYEDRFKLKMLKINSQRIEP